VSKEAGSGMRIVLLLFCVRLEAVRRERRNTAAPEKGTDKLVASSYSSVYCSFIFK
jgi:hypothetical protein